MGTDSLGDDATFAQLLRGLLAAKGWPASRLARLLGVSPSGVSKWLTGTRPTPEMATRIESLLNQGGELVSPGRLRKVLEREIAELDRRTATARLKARLDVPPSPYRGLAAFREQDAAFFHGREGFAAALEELVRNHWFVPVIGPSGSGKSSLVFAGLLPRLREGWDLSIAWFRPGSDPFGALAAALLSLMEPELSEADRLLEVGKLARGLRRGTLDLPTVAEQVLAIAGREHLMLAVDQLEELYTLVAAHEDRQAFLDVLLGAIPSEGKRSRVRLVTTLRADFLGQALSYRPLADAFGVDLKLGPMNRRELQDAIERPAAQLGVGVEDGLTARILDAVGGQPGQLPLLEFALTRLWEGQRRGQLTHDAYDEMGGVERALPGFAEEIWWQLSPQDQERARRIFVQVVAPGEGTEDTRRAATRTEVGEENWALVGRLASSRLLVTGRDGAREQQTVELVHEALIVRWDRLRGWLEEDRAFRSWQERLRIALRQWEASDRDEGFLLRGLSLAEAVGWSDTRAADVNAAETDFIRASQIAQAEAENEREDERQRALEQAQALAQAARQRAEQQRANARLRGHLALLLAAVSLIAVIAAASVWVLRDRTQHLLDLSNQQLSALKRYRLFLVTRYTPDGSPDLGLVGSGRFTTDFALSADEGANAVSVDPQGRILVAGSAYVIREQATCPLPPHWCIAVARYNPIGSLDPAMDVDGKLYTTFPESSETEANAIAPDPQAGILVAGTALVHGRHRLALVRYHPDGSLDTGFSGDGRILADLGDMTPGPQALSVDPEGRILVAATVLVDSERRLVLARYASDGAPDAGFAKDGKVLADLRELAEMPQAMAVDPEGRVLVAGMARVGGQRRPMVVRYNADGSLDRSFKAIVERDDAAEEVRALAVDGQARILVAEAALVGGRRGLVVVRYKADGAPDASFKLTAELGKAGGQQVKALTVDHEGRILVVGWLPHP